MQFSAALIAALSLIGTSVALTPIALGHQFRVSSINYNIAYVEGKDPCVEDVAISLDGEERCDRPFKIGGDTYELKQCSQRDWHILKNGKWAGDCRNIESKKVSCNGDTHDVIKTAICA